MEGNEIKGNEIKGNEIKGNEIKDVADAKKYNDLGISDTLSSNFEKAQKEFRESIKMDPNLAEPHGNLGILYLRIGKKNDAAEEILKAKELFKKRR